MCLLLSLTRGHLSNVANFLASWVALWERDDCKDSISPSLFPFFLLCGWLYQAPGFMWTKSVYSFTGSKVHHQHPVYFSVSVSVNWFGQSLVWSADYLSAIMAFIDISMPHVCDGWKIAEPGHKATNKKEVVRWPQQLLHDSTVKATPGWDHMDMSNIYRTNWVLQVSKYLFYTNPTPFSAHDSITITVQCINATAWTVWLYNLGCITMTV